MRTDHSKWTFKGSRAKAPSPARRTRQSTSPPRRKSPPPPLASTSAPKPTFSPANDDAESSEEEIGPSLPTLPIPAHTASASSYSDRRLAQEEQEDLERAQRRSAKKSDRREAFERADELVPKAVGKEGKMAEKKAANSVNKEMRDKEVGGLEMDEGTLMGGEESSFRSA